MLRQGVVSWADPVRRLRRGVEQAAHTLNNPQMEGTGVLLCVSREYLQLQLNCIGDKSRQRALHYR